MTLIITILLMLILVVLCLIFGGIANIDSNLCDLCWHIGDKEK